MAEITKLSRVAAEKAILELMKAAGQAPNVEFARSIVAARGGPKGANMDRGMIYYLGASKSNSGEPELFLTYSRKAYARDQWYNGAACLTATVRSSEFELIDAATACGVDSIRSANLGVVGLTMEEANSLLIQAIEKKIADGSIVTGNTEDEALDSEDEANLESEATDLDEALADLEDESDSPGYDN